MDYRSWFEKPMFSTFGAQGGRAAPERNRAAVSLLLVLGGRFRGGGTVDAQPRRSAAYADLVSALLDLRSPGPTDAFDLALQRAVDEGAVSPDLARELRWLQRESVRSIIRHAQLVLPVTLLALEQDADDEDPATDTGPEQDTQHERPEQHDDEPDTETGGPPVSARRLLVAGLRPLHDSPGMTP